MVRDVKGVDDNPFDFDTLKKNIYEALKDFKNSFEVSDADCSKTKKNSASTSRMSDDAKSCNIS